MSTYNHSCLRPLWSLGKHLQPVFQEQLFIYLTALTTLLDGTGNIVSQNGFQSLFSRCTNVPIELHVVFPIKEHLSA